LPAASFALRASFTFGVIRFAVIGLRRHLPTVSFASLSLACGVIRLRVIGHW